MARCYLYPFLFTLLACGDGEVPSTSAGEGGGASVSTSTSGSGGASASASGGASGSSSGSGSGSEFVPSDPAELFTYLQSKGYAGFASESAVHPSTGPHGGPVRTYVNAALNASLAANNTEHPKGAASVKELYAADSTTLEGWAVLVKNQDASAAGQGYYWYEHFSVTDGSNPAFSGQGLGLCVNCHAPGKDFFLTPYPLK
jgi:hypothetical protein